MRLKRKDKPLFIMMVGLPGSGKSTVAQNLSLMYDCEIKSSDTIRYELFGDDYIYNSEDNIRVFSKLHKDIRSALMNGKNVIYDATNIKMKTRVKFLNKTLAGIVCQKICYYVAKPIDQCIESVIERTHGYVPPVDVVNMYMNLQIPYYYEGWDNIRIYRTGFIKDSTRWLFRNTMCGLDYTYVETQDEHCYSIGLLSQVMFTKLNRKNLPKFVSSAGLFSLIGYHNVNKHHELIKQLEPYKQLSFSSDTVNNIVTTKFKNTDINLSHLFNMSAQDSMFYTNKTYFGPLRFISDKLDNQRYSLDVAVLIQWLMLSKRFGVNSDTIRKQLGSKLCGYLDKLDTYVLPIFSLSNDDSNDIIPDDENNSSEEDIASDDITTDTSMM